MVNVKSSDDITYQLVKFVGSDGKKLKEININEAPNFTGSVIYYNEKGERQKTDLFDKGVLKGSIDELVANDSLAIKKNRFQRT